MSAGDPPNNCTCCCHQQPMFVPPTAHDDARLHLYMAEIFSQLGNDFAALGNQLDRLEGCVSRIAGRVKKLEDWCTHIAVDGDALRRRVDELSHHCEFMEANRGDATEKVSLFVGGEDGVVNFLKTIAPKMQRVGVLGWDNVVKQVERLARRDKKHEPVKWFHDIVQFLIEARPAIDKAGILGWDSVVSEVKRLVEKEKKA